ncbi:MAG: hypothetical protein GJ676_20910 [Rhodobacteraceae bacterium]|nr:hypothetical protein [Paracoccaceae bacterium]
MIRVVWVSVLGLFVLAGCGADGEPVRPSVNTGIGISGDGVDVYGGVGLSKGPFNIHLGF